jgi:putative DNA primase/helicase
MDETKEFLDRLFAGKPDEEYILIWTADANGQKRSAWFRDLEGACAYAHSQERTANVYVGVATSPVDHGPHLRLKIDGAERLPASLYGFWSDLDILNPGHQKTNLPATEDQAREILFPQFQPSLLVHSGGGLQAWWRFKEPWTFAGEDEVREAAAQSARWNKALRAVARSKGWDLDPVADLTRVMRLPGTYNLKLAGNPRAVKLLEATDREYNPSSFVDLLDYLGVEAPRRDTLVQIAPGALVYRSDAEPPREALRLLCETDRKFAQSWEHQRKDMQDSSCSAYDMALANLAVQAGWEDQQIVDLLVAHRRRFGADLKLRDSYYLNTLRAARSTFRMAERLNELTRADAQVPVADEVTGELIMPKTQDPIQKKADRCDDISGWLGIKITRVVRYTTEPPEFALDTFTKAGEPMHVRLGRVENLIDQRPLSLALAGVTQQLLPRFKRDAWDGIAKQLLEASVDVNVGAEGTEAGQIRAWLDDYMSIKSIHETILDADENREPFVRDDRIYFYLRSFSKWLRNTHGEWKTGKELGVLFRRAKAEPDIVRCGRSTREVWAMPEGYQKPERPKASEAAR